TRWPRDWSSDVCSSDLRFRIMKIIQYISLIVVIGFLAGCEKTPTPSQMYQGQSAQQVFSTAETALAKENYTTAIQAFEALDSLRSEERRVGKGEKFIEE